MKKLLLMLLAILCLVSLTACGNDTAITEDNDIENFEQEVKEFEVIELPFDEKITEIYMEGVSVDVNYTAVKSALGYTLQYDADSYGISRDGNTDYYRFLEDMDRIYFSIELLSTDFEEISGEVLENNPNGYEVKYVGLIDGKEATADSPFSWDSEVVDTDYIKAEGRVYKIERHYYMEATEGAGVRIAHMVGTFKALKDM